MRQRSHAPATLNAHFDEVRPRMTLHYDSWVSGRDRIDRASIADAHPSKEVSSAFVPHRASNTSTMRASLRSSQTKSWCPTCDSRTALHMEYLALRCST